MDEFEYWDRSFHLIHTALLSHWGGVSSGVSWWPVGFKEIIVYVSLWLFPKPLTAWSVLSYEG